MTQGTDKLLFTPGPLTTSRQTRTALLRDWGSREPDFVELTAELRQMLVELVSGETSHVAIPIQGSGMFALEAALGTLVASSDKLLVLSNGTYGDRLAEIAKRLHLTHVFQRWEEKVAIDAAVVERLLAADTAISHVAMVHCETSSGLLNPLAEVADVVSARKRLLLVDAMSTLGGIPVDVRRTPVAAVIASANKCIEGVPGIAFAIVNRDVMATQGGVSRSLVLDLHDQWLGFERNGQWRFTPPVQVVAAMVSALHQLRQEGGVAVRHLRYRDNARILVAGMAALGFEPYLSARLQSPIIVAFHVPHRAGFTLPRFHSALQARSLIIYPGKLTSAETFRVGCIGALVRADFETLLAGVREAMAEL